MPPLINEGVPSHFTAGTSVQFTRSLDDFLPSDGWVYTIYLNGLTQKFSSVASIIDGQFQIVFAPTDTASLNPGPYRYAERLSNAGTGQVFDITGDERVINIEPNVGSSAAGTFNTWEERTLAIIEAALSGRFTADIQAYQIAGRSVSKIPIVELRQIRGQLLSAIWQQNNPGRLGVPYRVAFDLPNDSQNYPPTWVDITGFDADL